MFRKLRDMRDTWRAMKNLDSVGTDLVPDDEVRLDVPSEDLPLEAAMQSVRGGDWTALSALLAQTRNGPDWDLRARHVGLAARAAVEDESWLYAWLRARPSDPDALVVYGDFLVGMAWEKRGARYAKYTSEEQFEGFFHYLEQSGPALYEAARANPADPTPWAVLVTYAMGSAGGARETFDEAWSELTARAPHHRDAHVRALQYHCRKWHGSDEEMFGFANEAADKAPPDSALQVLPLDAWLETLLVSGENEKGTWEDPAFRAAVDRALTVLPPDGPATYRWHRNDRNAVAMALWLQERPNAALDQFRAIGPYASSWPWEHLADDDSDPRKEFLDARESARVLIAAGRTDA